MVQDMMTIAGSWGLTLLVGGALLLFLGLTFLFITRSARASASWSAAP
jgi:hypothetical protein